MQQYKIESLQTLDVRNFLACDERYRDQPRREHRVTQIKKKIIENPASNPGLFQIVLFKEFPPDKPVKFKPVRFFPIFV